MNGLCDVQGCNRATYMGWRPLTERWGRKICEHHWRRHRDKKDSFDLFKEFKFRRPLGIRKPKVKKCVPRCSCGWELEFGHKESKPVRNKSAGCKACGTQRRPGHTYCDNCARERRKQANRERQRRHYRKAQNLTLLCAK